MGKCCFGDRADNILDVGDVLYLPPLSFITNKNRLKCIAMPGNRRITLPDTLKIELRKCDDVRETKVEKLSEIIFSGKLPYLITFGKDYKGFTRQGYSLAYETVLLFEYSFSQILFGCHKDPTTDQINIHLIPPKYPLDIEILHGEIPVAQFTEEQISEMYLTLKDQSKNLDNNKHKKIPLDEIMADFLSYTAIESDDEDDPYENVILGTTQEDRCKDDIYEDLSSAGIKHSTGRTYTTKSNSKDDGHYVIEYNDGHDVMETKMPATNNNNTNNGDVINKQKMAGKVETKMAATNNNNNVIKKQKMAGKMECLDENAGSYEHFKLTILNRAKRLNKGYEEVTSEMLLGNRNNNNKSKMSSLFRKPADDMTQKESNNAGGTKQKDYEIEPTDVEDESDSSDSEVPVLPVKTKVYSTRV